MLPVGARGVEDMADVLAAQVEWHRERPPMEAAKMLPTRHGSYRSWIRELKAAGSGAASHRRAANTREALLALATQNGPAEMRIAAAIALSPQLDEKERQQIRVACEATAAPALRRALTRVMDCSEEELEDELVSLAKRAT